MASLGGGSDSAYLEDGRDADDGLDTESGSSYVGSDTPDAAPLQPCPWQTFHLHDQECSRYFDCPSHLVERRLSVDEAGSTRVGHDTHPSENVGGGSQNQANPEQETARPLTLTDTPTRRDQEATEASPPSSEPLTLPIPLSSSPRQTRNLGDHEPDQTDTESTASGSDLYQESDTEGPAREAMDRSAPPSPVLDSRGSLASLRRDRELRTQGHPQGQSPSPQASPQARPDAMPDFELPRWQPDAEVTYCPICHSQFNIFVRKHHCRKCGRVVCNSCSPHRIIIPHQYIVRPPGSDIPLPQSLLIDGLGGGYFDVSGLSGGERVRLCNPCVPDPNTAPPLSPASPPAPSPRAAHHRSRSSIGNAYGASTHANRYGAVFAPSPSFDPYRYYSSRSRSITMGHAAHGPVGASSSSSSSSSSRPSRMDTYHSPFNRLRAGGPSGPESAPFPTRYGSLGHDASSSSSRHRALPSTPQIAEEDECPICHRELPSTSLDNYESLREAHITRCIVTHSAYGSPRGGNTGDEPPAAPRRTGMYAYTATEKDCIDDAECTICLEEFTVGIRMARLECLCRFHYSCISAWFINHPGRCPVHQHDGFGF
ncbi:hypothetical protein S40288_02194 [Stachybotrys chartarum IBT 40288]|nr:hypothetical protein S40288_02194 [Stachybotrys chartarum IBT 40288]